MFVSVRRLGDRILFVFLSDTGLVGEQTQCWTSHKRTIRALFAHDVYKMFEQCDHMPVHRKTESKHTDGSVKWLVTENFSFVENRHKNIECVEYVNSSRELTVCVNYLALPVLTLSY